MSSRTGRADARHAIFRSAAFGLSVRFALLFVVCLLVLDLGLGLTARWAIKHAARSNIEESLELYRSAFLSGGSAEIAQLLAANADEDEILLGHQASGGALLAGSLDLPSPTEGWTALAPEGTDADEALWVKTVRLADGSWLSAGVSSERYHDVAELMLAGAVWAIVIALPLAVLSGAVLSRTVMRRLTRIAETAEGVRAGRMSSRAPLEGTGDEFDRLAGHINAMLETIETLTRNLRNVSVGIAHELRTPLTRIRHRLVELKENGDPDRPGAPIEQALAEIDGALKTFDALLKIGQIEADVERRGFETVHLSDLVAELAEVYEPVANEQGKQLDVRVAPGVDLRGNRPLLAQLISNLLENAIEHTPAGTRIALELKDGPDGPRLIVEDDGPGIPAAERDRIFDRFYRLERSRSTRGSGLGLSLARSICTLHGFAITLDPAAPGARFEVAM